MNCSDYGSKAVNTKCIRVTCNLQSEHVNIIRVYISFITHPSFSGTCSHGNQRHTLEMVISVSLYSEEEMPPLSLLHGSEIPNQPE